MRTLLAFYLKTETVAIHILSPFYRTKFAAQVWPKNSSLTEELLKSAGVRKKQATNSNVSGDSFRDNVDPYCTRNQNLPLFLSASLVNVSRRIVAIPSSVSVAGDANHSFFIILLIFKLLKLLKYLYFNLLNLIRSSFFIFIIIITRKKKRRRRGWMPC